MLGQLKLVNPPAASLVRGDDGLFRTAGGEAAQADPQVRMVAGFVEKSNVNPAEAMVGMIANARRFEMQMKVIQDASANAERANSILSSNS
jgi:flagellar basal-body rod protein FlgF